MLPAKDEEELRKLQEEESLERQRNGLLNFCKGTFPGEFQVNWHHRAVCRVLNRFVAGEIKRLIITFPPRHGKSQIVSRQLPAFIFGRRPDAKVIATSYSADLASMMNADVQRIMDSPAYQAIFPDTQLAGARARAAGDQGKWLRNADIFQIVGRNGTYRSAGVGGGITGMGADFILIDDPIKNREEADSLVYREKLWNWYTSTLYTRLEKGAGISITLTRWHEDDLVGRLLDMAAKDPDADQWMILNFPAICELPEGVDERQPGEALWPGKYDVKTLNSIKTTVGSRNWSALFQQRPAPDQGLIIQKAWWKFYIVPPANCDKQIQSWDLAFVKSEKSDYVVGVVLGKVGADVYLLDMIRGRMSFTETLAGFRRFTAKWPEAEAKYVEQAANGAALVDSLRGEIGGIIAVAPHGTKIARVHACSPRIEAGNVWLPDPAVHPWVNVVLNEWTVFPAGTNDDIVDAMTQGLARLPWNRLDDWAPMGVGQDTFFPQVVGGTRHRPELWSGD